MTEGVRGCGYRKVGGTYLVGSGLGEPCDMLPLVMHECPTCGFKVPFSRVFMWINVKLLRVDSETHLGRPEECKCRGMHPMNPCPICFPPQEGKYGFMWVGREYTPESFMEEAKEMGVSKRIPKIPKGLELNKTWVLLAHRKVPIYNGSNGVTIQQIVGLAPAEPTKKPAIFYAFKPERIEKLIWKKDATPERIQELEEKGYTPILIDDKDPEEVKKHSPRGMKL